MALLDHVSDIKNILAAGLLDETKLSEISSRLSLILSLSVLLIKNNAKANELAKFNRQKYEKATGLLHELSYVKTLLLQTKVELLKLSKYRNNILSLKKAKVDLIKRFFDIKLLDKTAKDRIKYQEALADFDFENDDESVYDANLKTYLIYNRMKFFGLNGLKTISTLPSSKKALAGKYVAAWRERLYNKNT